MAGGQEGVQPGGELPVAKMDECVERLAQFLQIAHTTGVLVVKAGKVYLWVLLGGGGGDCCNVVSFTCRGAVPDHFISAFEQTAQSIY